MQKILNIQALRGIAALSVVAFHLIPIEGKYGAGVSVLPDFFTFGMFGVDLFFVISGFVMASLTKGQFQNTSNALTFLYHRLSRIYPVYWFYSALVLIIFLIQPTWVNSAQDNKINILSSFLLWPETTLPLINVGWTLIHEMYFYIIFTVFLFFVPEKKLGLALSLWAMAIIAIDLCTSTTNPVLNLIAHPLTIEFIAGCFLAMLFRQDSGFKNAMAIAVGAVTIVCLLISMAGPNEPNGWWRVGIYGAPSAAILYCLVVAEKQGVVLSKYLVKIGDASYSIYLVHVLVLSTLGKLFYALSINSLIGNFALMIILTVCVILSGLISYHLIEKPLMKASRKVYDFYKG